MLSFLIVFLFTVIIDGYDWSQLDLPHEHSTIFFANNPSFRTQCLSEKETCPYWEQVTSLPSANSTCWGYESNCSNRTSIIQCLGDSHGWVTSKEEQIDKFWRTADFGYIAEKRRELREFCSPFPSSSSSSSLECVDHLRY